MTKPKRIKQREDDYTANVEQASVTHQPTGLVFRVEAAPELSINPARLAALEIAGLVACGACWLPPGVIDRRKAHQIVPGDANAAGVDKWMLFVSVERWQAVFDDLMLTHGPDQAQQMLASSARRAGDAWIYRARLDRERPKV